jgi:hypothetical protein
MAIVRANPHLGEIVEYLDIHRDKYKSDDEARAYLSKDDNEWIDNEYLTCIRNTRYFISNYYAYRDEQEGFKGLYPFFDSQEIMHDEYRRLEREFGKVMALVLKARQMGSTTYNGAEFFHKTIFSEHVNGIIVGQDEDQSKFIMGMYESALDFIPWWMRPRIKQQQTGSLINFDERDDVLRQTRPGLKTWIYADNANKPSGVGRGRTFGRCLLSELSFWKNATQLSKSLFPTFNTPTGFYVMESTANGRNDAWHNLWRRAEAGKVEWQPIFIPFYRRAKTYSLPILKGEVFVLSKEETEMRDRIVAKEKFIISDETFKWMRNKKETFVAVDGDDSMFSQEYTSEPEESFQSSAITAFPRAIIRRFSRLTKDPLYIGEIHYDPHTGKEKTHLKSVAELRKHQPYFEVPYPESENRFHVWKLPVRGARYSMGADVALGNEGGDYSCVQVIKLSDGHERDEQVACWHGLINPTAYAGIICAIGMMYNEALAAVEVNSFGTGTNSLLMREYEYENIYRFKRLDRIKNFMTDISGFLSTPNSTDAIMARMSEAFLEDSIIINCRFTMDEFNDYTEQGAIGDGAHDDFVDSLMIALFCGHEGEFRSRREGTSQKRQASGNKFKVLDRFGTIMLETTSQAEAERFSMKQIGSSIVREAGATARVSLAGRKVQVPGDFQNTEYSPVHDGDGTAKRLYEDEGIPAEEITPELIAEFDAQEEEVQDNPESWKYV